MKKLFISFFFFLLTLFSFGQFSTGIRTGLNLSTMTGRSSADDDTKSGFIAGAAFGFLENYQVSDMISVDVELLFLTTGDKEKGTFDEGGERNMTIKENEVTFSQRYHYLRLPVMAKFTFGTDLKYYGIIGPYFGYKLGGHYKTKYQGITLKGRLRFKENKVEDNDIYLDPKEYRRFDLGLNIGGGVGKEIGPGRLEAELRFGMGFLDTNKFDSKDDKQQAKDNGYKAYKNINILFTIAYWYDLSK